MVYNLLHEKYRVDVPSLLPRDAENDRQLRGHSLKLKKMRSNKNIRSKFFTQRIVNMWNGLTNDVVTAETVDSFKNRLDNLWHDKWYDYDD